MRRPSSPCDGDVDGIDFSSEVLYCICELILYQNVKLVKKICIKPWLMSDLLLLLVVTVQPLVFSQHF